MRTIPAGEFKAKCLAILDQVNETGEAVLVTKRGKPVARVTSASEAAPRGMDADSIFGALRGMAVIKGDVVSSEHTDDEWSRLFDERWKRVTGEDSQ